MARRHLWAVRGLVYLLVEAEGAVNSGTRDDLADRAGQPRAPFIGMSPLRRQVSANVEHRAEPSSVAVQDRGEVVAEHTGGSITVRTARGPRSACTARRPEVFPRVRRNARSRAGCNRVASRNTGAIMYRVPLRASGAIASGVALVSLFGAAIPAMAKGGDRAPEPPAAVAFECVEPATPPETPAAPPETPTAPPETPTATAT